MRIRCTQLLMLTVCIAMFAFSSCNKKCDSVPDNVDSGEIKQETYVFPSGTISTTTWSSEEYLVTATHPLADEFKISTDNGVTKSNVDYSEYSLLCYPITTSCYATFDRNIVINDVTKIVTYTIKVTECGKCDGQRYIDNWVAIRGIDDTYTVLYDVETTTVN